MPIVGVNKLIGYMQALLRKVTRLRSKIFSRMVETLDAIVSEIRRQNWVNENPL